MDIIDEAQDTILRENDSLLSQAHEIAANIPKGEPGECDYCGVDSPRLVRGICAPCRDEFKLD